MKKIIFSFIIIFLSSSIISSQTISGYLNNDFKLEIKNIQTVSLKITVQLKGKRPITRYLQPGQTFVCPQKIVKNNDAKKIKIKTAYDQKSYEMDLGRIKYVYNQRERQRQADAITMAIFSFADEALFDGFFGDVVSVVEYGDMLINGATAEQWTEKLAVDVIENEAINQANNNWEKGAVAAAFELAKNFGDSRYKDLENYTIYILNTLKSNKMTNSLTAAQLNLTYPKKSAYPNIAIEIGVLIKNDVTQTLDDLQLWKVGNKINDADFSALESSPYKIGGIIHFKNLGIKGGYLKSGKLLSLVDVQPNIGFESESIYGGLFIHSGTFLASKPIAIDFGATYYHLSLHELVRGFDESWTKTGNTEIEGFASMDMGIAITFAQGLKIRGEYALGFKGMKEENEEPEFSRSTASISLVIPLVRFGRSF